MNKNYEIKEISFKLGALANEAMLSEASCYPSPGLVSPISTGSHNDMDYYTFIQSCSALHKYMILFANEGFSEKSPKEIFKAIRKVGIDAERAMFESTDGINTHKGMIFLLGVSISATAKALHDNISFSDIKNIIKDMTEGIVERELKNIDKNKKLTYGEQLYVDYGIEGIRGQVEKGLPLVFDYALDILKKEKDLTLNDRLVHVLIAIMIYLDDCNIIHRHSIEMLGISHKKAEEIIKLGGMKTKEGKEKIKELEEEFLKNRVSPGGCADLLAITLFFYLVEKTMYKNNSILK
ncbi:triphosphoribosyl-dephospho-CoA synthase CitG [Clostridium sp. ATCC 25772]|uniref:triphosphoribosyl-dephospho-CoA synthase CitG n=1 Tax=Clostridium sp. ATCC 25772 TaxID=1676991 RepID=UPI0007866CEC|nr:triphosphoribosyl-dephospho-CoA synthase CitG [Clostridium sp. ATCC 25772]